MSEKKITDFTIIRSLTLFEVDVYRLFDNVPKKFKFNLIEQTKNLIGSVIVLTVKAMETPPLDNELIIVKRNLLIEAQSELHAVEVRLSTLNDLMGISNEAKARLDIYLYDTYRNFSRLINSFNKRLNVSDVQNCGFDAEPDNIRMPNCTLKGILDV